MTDASKPLSAREFAEQIYHGRFFGSLPDLIAARDADLIREAQAEAWQQAIEAQCDYCGGRAFESTGKEIPFQFPSDNNWYHRVTSPCRAANLHNLHPDPTYRERIEAQARLEVLQKLNNNRERSLVVSLASEIVEAHAALERLKPAEGK